MDGDGYVHVLARTDDVINVAGHRLSTGHLEECLASHPLVAECAIVGVRDELKGQLPVGLIVLTNTAAPDAGPQVVADVVASVRSQVRLPAASTPRNGSTAHLLRPCALRSALSPPSKPPPL